MFIKVPNIRFQDKPSSGSWNLWTGGHEEATTHFSRLCNSSLRTMKRSYDSDSMEEIYSRKTKIDSVIVTNEPFLVEPTKCNFLLHEFLVLRIGMNYYCRCVLTFWLPYYWSTNMLKVCFNRTSDPCTVAKFAAVAFQTKCVGTCTMYLRSKFHTLSPKVSIVIVINLFSKEIFL
jgi:hypothetical protein